MSKRTESRECPEVSQALPPSLKYKTSVTANAVALQRLAEPAN
jgi:hypothetical protein